MRLRTALWFPAAAFVAMRKPVAGSTCLLLQATLVGWPLAAAWAAHDLIAWQSDRRLMLATSVAHVSGLSRSA